MRDEQILNLTEIDSEDFKAIEAAVENWKASGMSGSFVFITEQEKQECVEAVKQAFERIYNKGAIAGGVAAFAGIGVGIIIGKAYLYLKSKKKK